MCLQYKSLKNTVGKGEIARKLSAISFKFEIVVCKLFDLGRV